MRFLSGGGVSVGVNDSESVLRGANVGFCNGWNGIALVDVDAGNRFWLLNGEKLGALGLSEVMDLEDGIGDSGLTMNGEAEAGLSCSPSEPRGGRSAKDENVRFCPCVEEPAPGVDVKI